MQGTSDKRRESGFAMILVAVIVGGMMVLLVLNLSMTRAHAVKGEVQRESFVARQIAESAAAQAIARLKQAGLTTPMSGGGASAVWVGFSSGEMYYYTTFDSSNNVNVVRAWGRVAAESSTSGCTVAPDSVSWDGTGYIVEGVEVVLSGYKYVPEAPAYFGNGGIERPLGGFEWIGTGDITDRSTWATVTSSPTSYQASWVPFVSSALDHPYDYIYNGGTPTPASTNPHPYRLWAAQNEIGQFNIEAWFQNSAGFGNDPTINLQPPPTSSYYDVSDITSPDYPYPVVSDLPDVQSFSWDLWNKYKNDPSATLLSQGSYAGEYGDLTTPGVTIVTGKLTVDPGTSFRGAGILVIRDDFDPNVDTNNTPSIKASLEVRGTFEWTGLVIVAGWGPDITVTTDAGAEATIVGSLFGEDSVQSGGETSLDSATIALMINNPFRLLYSDSIFQQGGLIYPFLPSTSKEVVGSRDL